MGTKNAGASGALDEDDIVARVEKTPPTHAKGMRDLLGISMNVRQGEAFRAMRLDFELNCGTASLRINGGDFVVSLKTCFVSLDLEGCEIRPHSRYEHRLAVGTVESTATETRDLRNSREVGAGVEASVDGRTLSNLAGRIWGRANRTKKVDDKSQEIVKRQPRIDLVVAAGQDRWQVGDSINGDVRRTDGRLFGTYFGEEREDDGTQKALCEIAGADLVEASLIRASALVRLGQVLVHLGTEVASDPQREDLDAEMGKRGRQVHAIHRQAEADLRARVAGLVLAKGIHAAQREAGLPVEGEILLARQSASVVPRRAARLAQGRT